jgi:hypothetical protein
MATLNFKPLNFKPRKKNSTLAKRKNKNHVFGF